MLLFSAVEKLPSLQSLQPELPQEFQPTIVLDDDSNGNNIPVVIVFH